MAIVIDAEKCNGCGVCAEICPGDVLTVEDKVAKVVYSDECEYCGTCMMDCQHEAIKVIFPRNARPVILRDGGISNSCRQ